VHLVGSVPLSGPEEVFRTTVGILDGRLRRVPDGETGERSDWIIWQFPVLRSRPEFDVLPPDPDHYRPLPRVKFRSDADRAGLRFEDLGYARAASDSYAVFRRLKDEQALPRDLRFQVCLPTPVAPIEAFVDPPDRPEVEPPYERRMLEELAQIVDAVPAGELAIQWDTTIEFGLLEGVFQPWFDDVSGAIRQRLKRLGNVVPPEVELGFHLCYGDARHKHFKEPADLSWPASVAAGLSDDLDRPLNWLHMPVPRNRDDDAYFEPLRDLPLRPETELYLGLVHMTDGVEGTRRRIRTAERFVSPFGVATECGFGRRPPETIGELLRIHAEVSSPLAGDG
jgi:hypothetical protein